MYEYHIYTWYMIYVCIYSVLHTVWYMYIHVYPIDIQTYTLTFFILKTQKKQPGKIAVCSSAELCSCFTVLWWNIGQPYWKMLHNMLHCHYVSKIGSLRIFNFRVFIDVLSFRFLVVLRDFLGKTTSRTQKHKRVNFMANKFHFNAKKVNK